MIVAIHPGEVSGAIQAPSSKSVMLRAVAAGTLAADRTVIRYPSRCDDAMAALGIARDLGARVTSLKDRVEIQGSGQPTGEILDCGESGLCMRMFAPLAALNDRPLTLTGKESLLRRPVGPIVGPLRELGVQCSLSDGFLPMTVRGPLRGSSARVDGSFSSQYLTGLLMALPLAERDSILEVRNLQSRPYIDLTLRLLKLFNVELGHENYQRFLIPGGQTYHGADLTVEGDWSGAAFPLVAGAVAGCVRVTGLDLNSAQADRRIVEALELSGAIIRYETEALAVSRGKARPFEFDATHCPDLFPPLVVLACHCPGVTRLKGVGRLYHKESDRAGALTEEFTRLGAGIEVEGDEMTISGSTLTGGRIHSRNDHRIAMAAAVAALRAAGPVSILQAEAVNKSYPEFFRDLEKVGGQVVQES